MKLIKKQLFTIILIFSAFFSNSQTILHGYITDSNTGTPIKFSKILLIENEIIITTTTTDIDGFYKFSNIASGIYDIEVASYGYITQRKSQVVITKDKITRIDFTIQKLNTSDHIVELSKPNDRNITRISQGKINTISSAEKNGVFSDKVMLKESTMTTPSYNNALLPSSGQMTVGEWNDLHNWKDWINLMSNQDYSIMTDRFEIYPTIRYSVLTLNKDNAVLPNIKVQLTNGSKIIWESITDNAGKAELWRSPYQSNTETEGYKLIIGNKIITTPKEIDQGTNTVILDKICSSPKKMDIVFTVDATSSMNDEIQYLKSELLDVIDRIQKLNEDVSYRMGSVFYRDHRDEYVTKETPLTVEKENIISFIKQQNAHGGGDKPEAVDEAIEKTLNLNWDSESLKIVFLILDAPPHEDAATIQKIQNQIKKAAKKGIKIIPITASGIGRETEFLMKFISILTNGTYIFITDDSGIGESHLNPIVKNYEVEKLNDCIVRLINLYSKSYSCQELKTDQELNVSIFPNPAVHYINVKTDKIPQKINILSSNGMVVRSIQTTEKLTKINLDDFVNGVYTLAIYYKNMVKSKQIIILH